jgi:hypothetical protein
VIRDSDSDSSVAVAVSLQDIIKGAGLTAVSREEEINLRMYLQQSMAVEQDLQTSSAAERRTRIVLSGTLPLETYWEKEVGHISHRDSNQ